MASLFKRNTVFFGSVLVLGSVSLKLHCFGWIFDPFFVRDHDLTKHYIIVSIASQFCVH